MKLIFVLLIFSTTNIVDAQSKKVPTIRANVSTALARLGLENEIKLGQTSIDGNSVTAHFLTITDKNFVLEFLKKSEDFKQSNGISLWLFHRGAKKSFRQLSDPSLHIVWYENDIEIHFDMHCPGVTHPIKSYRHFREVVVNLLYRSTTSQRRVALGLENNPK